jgi:hypothetical protein
MFGYTILSMSVRIRKLRKSTFWRQDLTKSIRQILTTIVRAKNSNRSIK